jgi:hypothetical protein
MTATGMARDVCKAAYRAALFENEKMLRFEQTCEDGREFANTHRLEAQERDHGRMHADAMGRFEVGRSGKPLGTH